MKRKKGKTAKKVTTKSVTVKKEPGTLAVPQVTEGILLDYMAGSGAKNLSQIQKKLFVETAKGFNLNPLKREVYAIAYKNQAGSYDMSIITGYGVYLKRAERSGKLSGWKVWTEGMGAELKACINIWRKDFKEPVYHEVYLREYNTGKSLWIKKPITMIKKVAIAQGFRLAFPDELGGVPYTADELPENMTNIHPIQPKKTDKPKEPAIAETPNPESVPESSKVPASRQGQEIILKGVWSKMHKFNPDRFTAKFYADTLELVAPGAKATKDLNGKQITKLIEKLEIKFRDEEEANNGKHKG